MPSPPGYPNYWAAPLDRVMADLQTGAGGLTSVEARQRRARYGPNTLEQRSQAGPLRLLLAQFKNPLVLILVFAALISISVGEWIDATVVMTVVLGSAALGFWQEYRATTAVAKLRARVTLKATVLRDGHPEPVPTEDIVPGDVVLLSAGSLIPADGLVLTAKDFFVNQAVLTGETFPVEKRPGLAASTASLAERTNCVFMGTSVRSGTAQALMVETGMATRYGEIAQHLTLGPPETEFERGIRHFGYLLTQVMTFLVLAVFAINVFSQKPPIDSLLFAIALAVGLTPELLPAIITVNLSQGARDMAQHGVIVRRLSAIENLGSMDVLCTDKTGTLTVGVVELDGALDVAGQPSEAVLRAAFLNATWQTGLSNPMDEAIVAAAEQAGLTTGSDEKEDEIPYDFVRKRLSIVARHADGSFSLLTKGALDNMLAVCSHVQSDGRVIPLAGSRREQIQQHYTEWSSQGYRVLGVAVKTVAQQDTYSRDDEQDLVFIGFLLFFDPPKPDVQQTLRDLARLGVTLKVITGDNRLVAAHVADMVGLKVTGVLTGADLNNLREEALWRQAEAANLFVEVDPNQKERLIRALQKTGHVVGFMGDGINDAPALQDADVGISVDQAVDVAKEAADFVLLEHNLDVLRQGIEEGRRTFANSLKYIFTTTSANFGNMFSMAGASLFLPFLPLLAKQILLNNFLSDFPAVAIAQDNVDPELVDTPHRWDMRFIRNFMVVFGLVSSVFDYLTFGVLLWVVRATPEVFRTAWFVESLLTELVVALVVRTRRTFFRSRPGRLLWVSTLVVAVLTIALPYLPGHEWLDFVPLPLPLLGLLLLITLLYVAAAEVTKRFFYRWMGG
ncbi:MAG: magnesium-translocating P-type ATPase [Anaerolineae bacterium]|nr:magnesium-translocating P-type ATPase [Anaerolineae bacterium]